MILKQVKVKAREVRINRELECKCNKKVKVSRYRITNEYKCADCRGLVEKKKGEK